MTNATRFDRLLLLAVLPLCGCAAGPTRVVPTTPVAAAASAPAAPPAADLPDTRRVRGVGWSAAIPAGWTDGADEHGTPMWTTPLAPSHPQRRAFSVQVVRGGESFDQLVDSLPAIYQQREAVATTRRFTHQGRPAAEVEVRFPASVQQLPTFLGVFIEGHDGVIVTCGGERDETVERFCRAVIESLWMGPNARATPPGRAPSGTRWFGGQGRYVQIPEARGPLAGMSSAQGDALGAADDGEHHAVVLHFLNDVQIPAQQALQGAVRGITGDRANTIVRQEPYQHGRRVGVLIDSTRAAMHTTPTTLVQWVMSAGVGAFYTLNCAGPADDIAARPQVCRDVLTSFAPVPAP